MQCPRWMRSAGLTKARSKQHAFNLQAHAFNACITNRRAHPAAALQLCRGSSIAFPQPRKREAMPPELQRRLQQLKARLEQQQYDAMVADVTQVRWLWLFI